MKIAFVGTKGIPATFGGVEYHVDRLAREMARRGHEVTVYVRSWYTARSLRAYEGVRLVHLPTIPTKHLDATIHSFLASLHCIATRPDIVHYQAVGPSFFCGIPRLRGSRIVATIHRLDWAADKWGPFARVMLRRGEWMAVHVPHRTIVISREIGDDVVRRLRRPTRWIPNGIEPPRPRPLRRLAEKYGLEKDGYILYLGRLVPEKRPDWLIRAYREILPRLSGADRPKLVVTGGSSRTGGYIRELKALSEGCPEIILTGYLWGEDKEELLSNARLFVLPSRLEGHPVALLEAQSYGLDCLVSDLPIHQSVIRNSEDGVLFRSDDYADLVAKLVASILNPTRPQRPGRTQSGPPLRGLSWSEVADRTLEVYASALDGRGAGKR
jgi:glycosyltransferase involved in cell wall biosynthesis